MTIDVKYQTEASATGGRDGHARTQDGALDVKLATPKELGGAGGDGTNPEQLFAPRRRSWSRRHTRSARTPMPRAAMWMSA